MSSRFPGTLDYLEEGMRGDLEGQPQQILVDVPVPSHVLQGQALLAGSLSVGDGTSWSVSPTLAGRPPPPPHSSSPLSLLHEVEAGHPTGLARPCYEVLCQGGLQLRQLLRAQFLENAVEKAL